MTEYDEYTIVTFSNVVSMEIDPSLENALQLAFDWANKMGFKGQEVKALTFVPPSFSDGRVTGGKLKCLIPKKENKDND